MGDKVRELGLAANFLNERDLARLRADGPLMTGAC
jgi:hypothetical protein